ncbi:MAG: response regulator [Pseudomonadota bacterium]
MKFLNVINLEHYKLTQYPLELIKIVTNAERKSAFANFFSMLVFVGAVFQSVPDMYLLIWFILHSSYIVVRTYFFAKLKQSLAERTANHINSKAEKVYYYLRIISLLIFCSSVLWGMAMWMVVIYAPVAYVFFTLVLILGLSSGAIATLSSVQHLYIAYTFPMMIMQFFALIYAGESIYFFVAILTILYTSVVYSGSRALYSYMKDGIKQREAVEYARQEADKANNAKSAFLANMSHEIRTPINAILGFSRLAYMNVENVQQKNYLHKIYTSSEILLGLINDILDSSKIQEKKLKLESIPFNLIEVVHQVCELTLQKAEQKSIELIYDIAKDVPGKLIGDPLRVTQLLTNFFSNAIKFTHRGHVSLVVKKLKSDDKIITIKFEICDTGIGIKQEQIKFIFDSFYQTDIKHSRNYSGTGLGLTICKNLIEQMGGEIYVQSSINQGTCFSFNLSFILPLIYNDDTLTAQQTEIAFNPPEALIKNISGASILLVEDCDINQELVKSILPSWGIAVTAVDNGKKAIELLQQQNFDLVLMDIQMPEMDGYETTRIIRSNQYLSDIIIIAMTAHAMLGDKENMLAKGMNDYISKPFRLEIFFYTLYKWLKVAVKVNQDHATTIASISDYDNDDIKSYLEENNLTTIEGINLNTGLQNIANNKKLYFSLLETFKQRLDQDAILVDCLLTRNTSEIAKIEQAYDVVHNFKGLSGNLGAKELSQACAELLDVLEQYEDNGEFSDINSRENSLNKKLQQFNYCVKVLQTSLSEIGSRQNLANNFNQ